MFKAGGLKGSSFGAPTLLETELAKLVLSDFPHLEKIRFVSSGTEATMSAIRLARGFTKKDKILKFEGCYHGHSDSLLVSAGSGAATFNSPSSLGVLEDVAKHTLVAKYNDINSVKELFEKNKDIACVIIEPIAGNMGLVPAKQDFLEELAKICKNNQTLLIFDEVMSGYRASYLGSYGINHIQADIITFGKVIGGGLPAAAFASSCHVGSMFGYFFTKNPVLNYQDALKSDLALFSKFHKNMLENGIYLAPSQFETGFICSKMDDKVIDITLEAVRESFKRI